MRANLRRFRPVLVLSLAGTISCGGDTPSPPTTPQPGQASDPPPLTKEVGTFTDSTGRTAQYRLWVGSGWDPKEPRGVLVYFHGNTMGTATQALASSLVAEPRYLEAAFDLGLAVAAVASPGSSPPGHPRRLFGSEFDRGGTRGWRSRDRRLVHELLQNDFNSTLAVDTNRVVFVGSSQGACFLADFFEHYAAVYGGGYHLYCGCFWGSPGYLEPRRESPWSPTLPWTTANAAFVNERLRVAVQDTTGDFLYDHAVLMARYYSETLGLDTQVDIEGAGGHCALPTIPFPEVWDWLSGGFRAGSGGSSIATESDADGDGVPDGADNDDDNDGAWDVVDALPLDPGAWLDSDRDGIGDSRDDDADGDGVRNEADAFSLDPREWRDNDRDGIGDNLDADDDNDGLSDEVDPRPLEGVAGPGLSFRRVETVTVRRFGAYQREASVRSSPAASVRYPEPEGDRQSYQFLRLGDGGEWRVEIMIDRFEDNRSCETVLLPGLCDDPLFASPPHPKVLPFVNYVDRIYVDRNRNLDLTDDGPPGVMARNAEDDPRFSAPWPSVNAVLELSYPSGVTLPYGVRSGPPTGWSPVCSTRVEGSGSGRSRRRPEAGS